MFEWNFTTLQLAFASTYTLQYGLLKCYIKDDIEDKL